MSDGFRIRGIIEGFYGTPWSHAERLSMLDFIGARGMNTFVVAPKDEPGQRLAWREPLSQERLDDARALVRHGSAVGVDVGFAISPGQTICYASESDREALWRRTQQLLEAGANPVALLLDDIPDHLQHPGDIEAYADVASAHADLVNWLAGRVREAAPTVTFIACPMVYRGTGDDPYVVSLGAQVDPRVEFFWTGRQVCSHFLDLIDAAQVFRFMNRPPLYWDNYPVNDAAMTHELHIGPLLRRDRHLYRFSAGLLANPMDRAESSKIAIATIADYLRDPEGYEPFASWDRALEDLIPDAADRAAYRAFARTSMGSCLNDDDAPEVHEALARAAFEWRSGDGAACVATLRRLSGSIAEAAARLGRDGFSNATLVHEARPWIDKYAAGGEAARIVADALETWPDRATDTLGIVDEQARLLRDRRYRVFGDSFDMFLTELHADLAAALADRGTSPTLEEGRG